MNPYESYLHEYEQLVRSLTPEEQAQENALAFKEMRNAGRAYDLASQRWLIVCGVRLETVAESDSLAPVIPLPRVSGEALVREEL